MPIASTDIAYKLSVTTGSAGNSTAGTPAGSLGKYISTTSIVDATADNLFDDISGAENAASDVEYRCFFLHNAHATLTALNAVVYISAQVAGGASVQIGVDPTAASAIGSSSAQAVTVADEQTAPAGVAFSAPTTAATGLALGDIPAGSCRAVWVKRTAANTGAVDADGATIAWTCDTAA